MKAKVKICGNSPYGEYKKGDMGIVDGYCRGGDETPCAIVILDKDASFVMVYIHQLSFINWEYDRH